MGAGPREVGERAERGQVRLWRPRGGQLVFLGLILLEFFSIMKILRNGTVTIAVWDTFLSLAFSLVFEP